MWGTLPAAAKINSGECSEREEEEEEEEEDWEVEGSPDCGIDPWAGAGGRGVWRV